MFGWARSRLAIRQAGYAVAAIFVIASLVSLVEVVQLYADERARLTATQRQQTGVISGAAARAAFHVDEIQAATILEGLFHFENLEWARISTDLGQVLAERRRAPPGAFADPLARYLFGDIAFYRLPLRAPETGATKIVGSLELRTSPELAGGAFLGGITPFVAGLLFQFVLLGVTLVVIFHRTLTLPILAHADAVSGLSTAQTGLPRLEIPAGHKEDELGTVVVRTNQLLDRIENQHQELLHREKVAALGTLLASVSHELNNPLAILAVQSELLVETANDAKTRQRGEKILAMANRCAVIVRRFLALARRREVVKETLDIADTIRDVLEILEHQLEQTGIETSVNVQEGLPPVFVDRSQITQLLLNLLINAEQAVADKDGTRLISVDAELLDQDSMVQILVADNGQGIPVEALGQIFQPFYTTKQEGHGTGLGLSYAHDVARTHGGDLTTAPSPLGGAAFLLTLPVAIETPSSGDEASDA